MQYDENAEKYGYEGEMTPMKCDKLKIYRTHTDNLGDNYIDAEFVDVVLKEDVDAAIAELKAEIRRKEGVEQRWFERCMEERTENAKLKKKLENVQASAYAESVDAGMENRRLKRALWIARAERYKMLEFIAREEGNLSNQMSWSRILRERTYNQWVDQLLRIANLANKLQNKCRAKAKRFQGGEMLVVSNGIECYCLPDCAICKSCHKRMTDIQECPEHNDTCDSDCEYYAELWDEDELKEELSLDEDNEARDERL